MSIGTDKDRLNIEEQQHVIINKIVQAELKELQGTDWNEKKLRNHYERQPLWKLLERLETIGV